MATEDPMGETAEESRPGVRSVYPLEPRPGLARASLEGDVGRGRDPDRVARDHLWKWNRHSQARVDPGSDALRLNQSRSLPSRGAQGRLGRPYMNKTVSSRSTPLNALVVAIGAVLVLIFLSYGLTRLLSRGEVMGRVEVAGTST